MLIGPACAQPPCPHTAFHAVRAGLCTAAAPLGGHAVWSEVPAPNARVS